ncbi:hypothetical protein D3C79_565350 [compost metagenome]
MLGDHIGVFCIPLGLGRRRHIQLHHQSALADHERRPRRYTGSREGEHRQRGHRAPGAVRIDHRQAQLGSGQARNQKAQRAAFRRHDIGKLAALRIQALAQAIQGLNRPEGVLATPDRFRCTHVRHYRGVAGTGLIHRDHPDAVVRVEIPDLERGQQMPGRRQGAATTTAKETTTVDQRLQILVLQLKRHDRAPAFGLRGQLDKRASQLRTVLAGG